MPPLPTQCVQVLKKHEGAVLCVKFNGMSWNLHACNILSERLVLFFCRTGPDCATMESTQSVIYERVQRTWL